jgi:enoyl-CoA hydratase/carnithine racemase
MILMAGVQVAADEALAWGLIDRIVPPESLQDRTAELAGPALAAKPGHAAAVKAMLG